MRSSDVVDFVEGAFRCDMGAPWRWADLGMSKPYQLMTVGMPEGTQDMEHRLSTAMIHRMQGLKDKTGLKQPRLFWRWAGKVRAEDSFMHARFYIDGNPGRPGGNPSHPWGSPSVGQVRLAA